MGAIMGCFNRTGAPVNIEVVENMLASVVERAVDGNDVWVQGQTAIACQHFHVLPEDRYNPQPIIDDQTGCVLAADVRLDNRVELYQALGLRRTEDQQISDAQLLLLSYLKWDVRCVEHLYGDYVFSLWDPRFSRFYLARDSMGAHSINYFINDTLLVFASEIEQVLTHPAVHRRINEEKIADYLTVNWFDQQSSFLKDIVYLQPGHYLTVTHDASHLVEYWRPDPHQTIRYASSTQYADHFRHLLEQAIHARLRCNGTIGVSMSGGLDSTSIAALAANMMEQSSTGQTVLPVFSYAFDRWQSCDERVYIKPMVNKWGLSSTFVFCDEQWTFKDSDTWPTQTDFVVSDPYARLPISVAETAAAEGCRVLLAGYYGDVLTQGGRFWALDLIHDHRWACLGKSMLNGYTRGIGLRQLFDWRLSSLLSWPVKERLKQCLPLKRTNRYAYAGLTQSFLRRSQLRQRLHDWQERAAQYPGPGQWRRVQALQQSIFAQGAAVTRKSYHRYGIELLQPYFDRRLLEFVLAVPASQLGIPGQNRRVHREAMVGILPESVRTRRHPTVFLPLMEFGLLEKEQAFVRSLLEQPQIVQRGYVDRSWLSTLIDQKNTESTAFYYLWQCMCLELWLRRYW